MHLMTGCYLITFCFPLWSYWKETITSHNYLQYCMCIAEYWIDIMSIEFGLTSAVIFQCIFHCLLKRNWEGGNSQSSLHSAELPLPFYISLPIFVLFSPLVRVTGSILPPAETHTRGFPPKRRCAGSWGSLNKQQQPPGPTMSYSCL